MINCKEIAEYLRYVEDNPKKNKSGEIASDQEHRFADITEK